MKWELTFTDNNGSEPRKFYSDTAIGAVKELLCDAIRNDCFDMDFIGDIVSFIDEIEDYGQGFHFVNHGGDMSDRYTIVVDLMTEQRTLTSAQFHEALSDVQADLADSMLDQCDELKIVTEAASKAGPVSSIDEALEQAEEKAQAMLAAIQNHRRKIQDLEATVVVADPGPVVVNLDTAYAPAAREIPPVQQLLANLIRHQIYDDDESYTDVCLDCAGEILKSFIVDVRIR